MPEPKPGKLSTPHTCGGSCSRIRERVCLGTPARYNTTQDLVPHVKSQSGWNATVHARRFFPSLVGSMGRERAKRNGILPAEAYVDRRWGVVGNVVQRFATTTVLYVTAVRESIRCWRGKEKKVGSGVV